MLILISIACTAVWHLNRRSNQDITPDKLVPVHACLCDAVDAHFLSFDGVEFRKRSFQHATPPVKGTKRVEEYVYESLNGIFSEAISVDNTNILGPVFQYTFALLLEGYYNAVKLYYNRSIKRGQTGDVSAQPYFMHYSVSHRFQMGARGSHRTVNVNPIPPSMRRAIDRLTNQGWHTTYRLAFESRAFFQRAHIIKSDEPADKGLKLLFERY